MAATTKLRQMLNEKKFIVAPGCFDPLTARIVEWLGFDAVYMGGNNTGWHLAVGEPLVTMTEQVEEAGKAAKLVDIPMIVDAGGGFGEPLHVMRTVREFEKAGIAGIHLEDQHYPKRMSYHKQPQLKHMHTAEEFLEKLKAALAARQDKDFVIIARTDAVGAVGGSFEETVRRGNLYAEAGADVIMPLFPTDTPLERLERYRKEVPNVPLVHLLGHGVPLSQIRDLGWNMVLYPATCAIVAAKAVIDVYRGLKENGYADTPYQADMMRLVQTEVLKMTEAWELEAQTVEKLAA